VITRLTADAKNEIRNCAIHLVQRNSQVIDGQTYAQWNAWQIGDVQAAMNPKAASGTAIVLGGDWNATPSDAPFSVFSPYFIDIDDPDVTPTFSVNNPNKKIDQILITDNNGRFYSWSGTVTDPSTCLTSTEPGGYCSDHRILKGDAVLKSLP
jgi:hypothetical protein